MKTGAEFVEEISADIVERKEHELKKKVECAMKTVRLEEARVKVAKESLTKANEDLDEVMKLTIDDINLDLDYTYSGSLLTVCGGMC